MTAQQILYNVSNDGQRYAVDFLINLQRIHIGHATDIIDDSHDACFKVGALYIVLATKTAEELLRIKPFGIYCGLNHRFHQRLHNFITS